MSANTGQDSGGPVGSGLPLTLRQRRLRVITGVLLVIIGAMVATGALHPFFRLRGVAAGVTLTDEVRRAIAAKAILILGYWTLCLLLAFTLFIIAWLYIRDIRLQLLIARRDIWREVARGDREERRD